MFWTDIRYISGLISDLNAWGGRMMMKLSRNKDFVPLYLETTLTCISGIIYRRLEARDLNYRLITAQT